MKRSNVQLMLISILVVAASIGLAAALAAFTPLETSQAIPVSGSLASRQPAKEVESSTAEESTSEPAEDNSEQENKRPFTLPEAVLDGGNKDAVKEGRLPGYEDSDINTDAEAFSYLLSSKVTFDQPDGEGNIMVENNPGNILPMQLQYVLSDSGRLVYTSAIIWPGEHIEKDRLSAALKADFYEATAILTAYDPNSMEPVISFQESVIIQVKDKKFFGIF